MSLPPAYSIRSIVHAYDGKVALELEPATKARFSLGLRVPGWCPGVSLAVNHSSVKAPVVEVGYLVLDREWKRGDRVELDLAMPVQRVAANPKVKADQGLLAIQRGPIVYCLESPDLPAGVVHAYKNTSDEPGLVFNAPNRLYAGEGKQAPVDEIRHEESAASLFVLD